MAYEGENEVGTYISWNVHFLHGHSLASRSTVRLDKLHVIQRIECLRIATFDHARENPYSRFRIAIHTAYCQAFTRA